MRLERRQSPSCGDAYRHLGMTLAISMAFAACRSPEVFGQDTRQPVATLTPAAPIRLPGAVDSNSPAVWLLEGGEPQLRVLTSTSGWPSLAVGAGLGRLGPATPVGWINHPGHGVWMESVITDDFGTWYGFYHNEIPAELCDREDRMLPRIGAARSHDAGVTWEDLGPILEAPPGWHECATPNRYFVGGVGDVSVVLDQEGKYLYLFFSQYSRYAWAQGVAQARLLWAARDEPVGRVEVRADDIWRPATHHMEVDEAGQQHASWVYDPGTPLLPVLHPWHDADRATDAFWGASVHWNTHLQQYVMLVNRTKDEQFGQEGIYVAYTPTLEDPGAWTVPTRLIGGGSWYPQVVGLQQGQGTDAVAGARARYFQGGVSNYFIDFAYR
jgi:hypothetical protein